MRFPHYTQHDAMDCDPTCLRMVARHYGRQWSLETLRQRSHITREGVTMLGISRAAESIGFRTLGAKLNMEQLTQQAPLPAILHWNQQHFVVLYRVTGRSGREVLHVADPAGGLVQHQPERPTAHAARCTYNPYIVRWHGQPGYAPVEQCGTFTPQGFQPDAERIERLLREQQEVSG